MTDNPPVSCICLPYGRPELLEEAIYAFLQQDYQGQKELVILNDHAGQFLAFDHPDVIIANLPKRFRTTAEKRNAAVALCSHELIFVWDEEDIYLPQRLSFSVENFAETTGFFKLDEAFVWGNGRLSGIQKSVFHNGSCWSRKLFDQVSGYAYMGNYGTDQAFEHQLRHKNSSPSSLTDTRPGDVYCIYRWQHKAHNGPLHLRGSEAAPGEIKQGVISLTPHWKFDYAQQVQDYLQTRPGSIKLRKSGRPTADVSVDFLVAGAQKSGTSALDAYLRSHPELCMAGRKEVHFFDNDRIFNNATVDFSSPERFFPIFGLTGAGIPDPATFAGDRYDLYHTFFSPAPPQRLCGEVTPSYMYWRSAPGRIWEYNPAMKIIIILRNPIDRAFSHWNMEFVKNRDRRPFRRAIAMDEQIARTKNPGQRKHRSYIDRGFFAEQIRRIWHYFPEEQTLILKQEALKNDPQETLNRICDFIGVSRLAGISATETHALPYAAAMSPEDRHYLKSIYAFEIRKLERLLNWDCTAWLEDW
jgi:hypothetical protein